MSAVLATVDWVEKTMQLEDYFAQMDSFIASSIKQGFEAEVVKLHSDLCGSYILKIWNKHSRPDVSFQYRLLIELLARGISVPRPLGWGRMPDGAHALLTAYDGMPVDPLHPDKMRDIAGILAELHQLNPSDIEELKLPQYDFAGYHYQGLEGHRDLAAALQQILQKVTIKRERIVHGDFHPENIVEDGKRYTVIDWTNAQLGDPRYDFAWSYFLLRLYLSEKHANHFRLVYMAAHELQQQELDLYEALGILRWMLLLRNGSIMAKPEVLQRVSKLLASHAVLEEFGFHKSE